MAEAVAHRNGRARDELGRYAKRATVTSNTPDQPWITQASVSRPRGRLTQDYVPGYWGSTPAILPPSDYEQEWQTFNLDADTFAKLSPSQLLNILADISPDVSRALWDFLRLFNPGWELICLQPGTDNQNEAAQQYCESIMALLDGLYGTVDVVHGRMAMSFFMRGALLCELVLAQNGRDCADLVVPDPVTVRFKREVDQVRGTVDVLGQWQQGKGWVDLSQRPTISYVPVDPAMGTPYGRAMVSPALFSSLFLLGVLHDLRRVLAQQGMPRIDLEIDLEAVAKEAPKSVLADPIKYRDWVSKVFDEVRQVYATLEPDDAYVHTSAVKVNRPVGTVSPQSLGALPAIIEIIERWTVRALKTMPVLMGTRQGNTETQANREWEIMSAGFKSIQHYAESVWERQLGLALRAQGMQAEVQFRYAELRASEMDRDAKTEATLILNEISKVLYGWQDNDAAAVAITGHPALMDFPPILPPMYTEVPPPTSDQEQEPDQEGDGEGQGSGGESADEGAERWVKAGILKVSDLHASRNDRQIGIPGRWLRVLTQRGPALRYRRDTHGGPPEAHRTASGSLNGGVAVRDNRPSGRAPEEAFTPEGDPLPEHQGTVEIGAADLRRMSASWDNQAPAAYTGLLEATTD